MHEPLVIGDHGRDLRLLQHDLRDPDRVWIALLPWQIVPAMALLPLDDIARERRHSWERGRRMIAPHGRHRTRVGSIVYRHGARRETRSAMTVYGFGHRTDDFRHGRAHMVRSLGRPEK